MDAMNLLTVVVVFVLAGTVKGITGMGLPTVAMSMLGLWMAPVQAAALIVAPSLATNLAQCRGAHLRSLVVRLWPGWAAVAVVTVCAPGFGGAVPMEAVRSLLGGTLVAYGAWGLWRPALPDLSVSGKWLGVVAGAATGVVTACTAVFVLPWVPYLQSLRLDKDEMVALLVDVYLSEAKVTVAGVPRDSAYKLFAHFDRSVTVSRGIADSTLTASYEYYFQRPEELEKILDAVIDTLNLREQRMAGTPD